MTTNQTIDGVPRDTIEITRELAEQLTEGWNGVNARIELRKMLDADKVNNRHKCSACNDTRRMHEPGCEPGACSACFEEPAAKPQGEPVAHMPVERCYDVRAKMIIAFNEAKKAGGDLDDALDAAYKSALRYSPNPMNAEQHAPVAVPRLEMAHVVRAHMEIPGCPVLTSNQCHALAMKLNESLNPSL